MILQQLKYIFKRSLLLGLLSLLTYFTYGQSEGPDSLLNSNDAEIKSELTVNSDSVVTDSIPPKKLLFGAEFLIDYGKILTLWTEFESKFEGGFNLRFYERIVLATEFGYAELNPLKAYDNALYYTVRGPYGRIGLDYYGAYDAKSFYYAGLRYGYSIFEDEGAFLIDSEYWEDYEDGFGSSDVTASWFEIVAGTETYLRIGKKMKEKEGEKSKLLLGWKFKLRFIMDFENRDEPRIYSIPGYGRTFDEIVPVLNFYVKYRIGN